MIDIPNTIWVELAALKENEKVIAGRLTKRLRLVLLAKDPAAPAQKLNFPKIGYA